MIVLPDSNVIVAGLIKVHQGHSRARAWLDRIHSGQIGLVVADRVVAEAYAVISTLPASPRIGGWQTWTMLEGVLKLARKRVSLSADETLKTIRSLAEQGLTGRIVFDALIARAAVKAKADVLLTFNTRHLLRVWPLDPAMVREP